MSFSDTLQPFGSTTECPKCGGQQMFRKYRVYRSSEMAANDEPVIGFMQVMCGGCGYSQMTEKTKDATPTDAEVTV